MTTSDILQVLEVGFRNGYRMGLDHAFWPAYLSGLFVGLVAPLISSGLTHLVRYCWKRWQARRAAAPRKVSRQRGVEPNSPW